ncbi:MAG: hypothetical protein ACREP2_08940 [Rhodanobacteraceae bacterium]
MGFGEAIIAEWHGAGLLKPSCFKPIPFTAEQTLLRKTLGTLTPADEQTLRETLQRITG